MHHKFGTDLPEESEVGVDELEAEDTQAELLHVLTLTETAWAGDVQGALSGT